MRPLVDAMQIALDPELPPSGGYESIVTAIGVFSRYLFACPTSSQDVKTVSKFVVNIMTKHAYFPTTEISDKGSVFMSQVINQMVEVLGHEPSRVFHVHIPYIILDLKATVRKKHPPQTHKIQKMSIKNRKYFPRCSQKDHTSVHKAQTLL